MMRIMTNQIWNSHNLLGRVAEGLCALSRLVPTTAEKTK